MPAAEAGGRDSRRHLLRDVVRVALSRRGNLDRLRPRTMAPAYRARRPAHRLAPPPRATHHRVRAHGAPPWHQLAALLHESSRARTMPTGRIYLIEEFFKCLKTGCAYEKRHLESLDNPPRRPRATRTHCLATVTAAALGAHAARRPRARRAHRATAPSPAGHARGHPTAAAADDPRRTACGRTPRGPPSAEWLTRAARARAR